jgi:hypothetical protein
MHKDEAAKAIEQMGLPVPQEESCTKNYCSRYHNPKIGAAQRVGFMR